MKAFIPFSHPSFVGTCCIVAAPYVQFSLVQKQLCHHYRQISNRNKRPIYPGVPVSGAFEGAKE
jgi:hypothetical protein